MNVFHNDAEFRISARSETMMSLETLPAYIQYFKDKTLDLQDIRIKYRSSLGFEFMQFDLSQTYHYSKKEYAELFQCLQSLI